MNLHVTGIGIWMRGIQHWAAFRVALDGGFANLPDAYEAPRPEAIPARERRRAGPTINLAVEVMHQACAMAGVPPSECATVFASAMGDTDITDYMCRKLATADRLLSPTKFHNSVHNAPSGYWSISAENRQPSSFVSGFEHSFAAGLLEAACCAVDADQPVGLAVYDVANEPPFHDVRAIREPLGVALMLQPGFAAAGGDLRLTLAPRGRAPTPQEPPAWLARLCEANPVAHGLPLLQALALERPARLALPLGLDLDLIVDFTGR